MISAEILKNSFRAHRSTWLLLLVGLLVCGGCLWADFYMDDFVFILRDDFGGRREWTANFFDLTTIGDASPKAESVPLSMLLPRLAFRFIYDHLGGSVEHQGLAPVAFHLWNLVCHLVIALLGQATVRRFLLATKLAPDQPQAARLGFWAAVIFLVHPLCTEPVNYAKCLYMQMVALSALWSCYTALRLATEPSLKRGLAWMGALLFSSGCYVYGFPIALAQSSLLILLCSPALRLWLRDSICHRSVQVALGLGLVVLLCYVKSMYRWYVWHLGQMEFSFSSHILTQGRVFWAYMARMVVPLGLCSDHHVAWSTTWADVGAVIALAAAVVVGLTGLGIAWRKRGERSGALALIGLLVMVPIVVRWPYASHEPMVEYRTYPSMIWVGLLWAYGLTRLTDWMVRLPQARVRSTATGLRLLGGCVVAFFSVLTIQRSQVWHSTATLEDDVIAQYPDNLRPYSQRTFRLHFFKQFQEVLAGQHELAAHFVALKEFNRTNPQHRQYDELWAEAQYLTGEGNAGAAIAYLHGVDEGLKFIKMRCDQLLQARPELYQSTGAHRPIRIGPLLNAYDAIKNQRAEIDATRPPGLLEATAEADAAAHKS